MQLSIVAIEALTVKFYIRREANLIYGREVLICTTQNVRSQKKKKLQYIMKRLYVPIEHEKMGKKESSAGGRKERGAYCTLPQSYGISQSCLFHIITFIIRRSNFADYEVPTNLPFHLPHTPDACAYRATYDHLGKQIEIIITLWSYFKTRNPD